tara:strand:- start:11682 stop:12029 length:348 start_codon:yes stop_codon:yes gene_type:complete
MSYELLKNLTLLAKLLEIIGASALFFGFLIVTIKCFYLCLKNKNISPIQDYKRSLARVVLIGLEILVAATIIKTISVNQTIENILLLVIIVTVRTILGWIMELEIKGKWPWQRSK